MAHLAQQAEEKKAAAKEAAPKVVAAEEEKKEKKDNAIIVAEAIPDKVFQNEADSAERLETPSNANEEVEGDAGSPTSAITETTTQAEAAGAKIKDGEAAAVQNTEP